MTGTRDPSENGQSPAREEGDVDQPSEQDDCLAQVGGAATDQMSAHNDGPARLPENGQLSFSSNGNSDDPVAPTDPGSNDGTGQKANKTPAEEPATPRRHARKAKGPRTNEEIPGPAGQKRKREDEDMGSPVMCDSSDVVDEHSQNK
jgi:hypothetical protein